MAGIELKKIALEDVPAASSNYVMLAASNDGLPVFRDGSGSATELATKAMFNSVSDALATKANSSEVYTKGEVDAMFAAYFGSISVESAFNPLQLFQRGIGEIAITGEINGDLTGDIEASFDGETWQTIATIEDGGFSGVFEPSETDFGVGPIRLRAKSRKQVTAQTSDVRIGDLYLVCGDSISQGAGNNPQQHELTELVPVCYREDDTWKEANDGVDLHTNVGSQWPLLARLLTTDSGVPVGFVTTGTGSRDIIGAGNIGYYAKGKAGYTLMTTQAGEAGNKFAAMLLHFGPNASTDATISLSTYKDALEQFVDDVHSDVLNGMPVYIGAYGRSDNGTNNNAIRNAIVQAATTKAGMELGPNLLGMHFADKVHPKTDVELATTAARWWASLHGHVSPNVTSASYSGNNVTLTFDRDLDAAITTYTAGMFRIKQGESYSTALSATRTGAREITIAFASITSESPTIDFVFSEAHSTATLPTSAPETLPVAVHGLTSVSQPANPCIDFPVTPPKTHLSFDGVDDYVSGGSDLAAWGSAQNITLEMNLTVTDSTDNRCAFSRQANRFKVFAYNGSLCFGSSTAWNEHPVADGLYRFIFDDSKTGVAKWRVFKDGVELTPTSTFGTHTTQTVANVINIGRNTGASSNSYWKGVIGNVKIWTRVVTPDDSDQTTGLIIDLGEVNETVWDNRTSAADFVVSGATPV